MTANERGMELERKRGELAALFEKHRRGDGEYDLPAAARAEVRARDDELARLQEDWEQARAAEAVAAENEEQRRWLGQVRRPAFAGSHPGNLKPGTWNLEPGIGRLILESAAVRGYRRGVQGPKAQLDVDLKTLMSTSAGWDPEDTRTGKVLLSAQERVRLLDMIPTARTSQSTVVYMEETTHTNNAAEISEAAAYPESALRYEPKSGEVRKIGVSLPLTDELLEDTPRLTDLLDNRLRFMLRKRLEQQVLTGNGTAPNLRGANNLVGINTYARAAEPEFDAVFKGMTLIRNTAFEEPDAVVLHPTDWQEMRLKRDSTGNYLLGDPDRDVQPRLFGLPVIATTHQTENTALIGCWQAHSELALRRGIEVQISNSYGTYFTEGKQMLRADLRVALLFDRPAAFCKVTGL